MIKTVKDIVFLLENSLKNYKLFIFLMIIISILAGVSDFYTVIIVRESIENYTNTELINNNLNRLYLNLIFITLCQVIKFFSVWANTKFLSYVGTNIALSIYKLYLEVNNNIFTNIKLSEVLDNTNSKVTYVTTGIYSLLNLISGLLSSFFLILSLTLIGGSITLFTISLLVAYYLICNITNRKKILNNSFIAKLGPEKILENSNQMWEDKDLIKLYDKERISINNFQKYNLKFRKAHADTAFQSLWPRYFLESIIVIGFIVILIFNIKENIFISNAWNLSGITAIALGIQKIIPSCQMVYKSVTSINGRSKSINSLASEFKKYNQIPRKINIRFRNFNDDNILVATNLSLSSGDGKNILRNINFEVKRGQTLLISGRSGSGKTTLLKCLIGALDYSGKIFYNSKFLKNYSRDIAYFKQSGFLGESTIKKVLLRWQNNPELITEKEMLGVIEGIQLQDIFKGSKNILDINIGDKNANLSGGQKSRVLLANTILRKSKILILDEPFSGLDNYTHDCILSFLKKLKYDAIILSSHNPRTADFCDKVIQLG